MTEMESMQPESLKTEQTPDPAETPAQAAAEEQPAEQPAETPAERPAEEQPAEQPAETPAEETAEQPRLDTPDYVRMTLDAGVAPLEVRYAQINSCYRRLPVAYRSFTYVNSVIEGVLSPAKYAYAADETDRGMRLLRDLGNISYDEAAQRLFSAQEWIDTRDWSTKERPCAVQVALERLRKGE